MRWQLRLSANARLQELSGNGKVDPQRVCTRLSLYSACMTYEQLADFVQNRMKMSPVYQPVMLMALLQGSGRSSTSEIARSILAHDESQIEYYENITRNMVGSVPREHGIVGKEGNGYSLAGYEDLSDDEIERLTDLCETKLNEYL